MPKIADNLTISDSLYKLLTDNTKKSKACKLLHSILERVQNGQQAKGDCPCPECRKARKGKVLLNEKRIGDFFAYREEPGKISYMPKGKTQKINEDGTWARAGRVSISPVKWMKSMIHPKLLKRFKDHDLSPFATILKAEEEAQRITFKFVPFSDAYNPDNYGDSVPDSCMFGKPVEKFYKLMGAKALVAINGKGVYYGRAVFWPNVRTDKGQLIQLVDRIYARSPEVTQLFKDHAREKGYHWKYKQNRSNLKDVVSPDEETHSYIMTVEAGEDLSGIFYFPFLDTFQGGLDDSSIVNQTNENNKKVIWGYATTNGEREEYEDHTGQVITADGEWIDEEDAIYVGGQYYRSGDSRIKECHHSGNWFLKRYCVYIEHGGFWVHQDYEDQYPPPPPTPEEAAALAKKEEAARKKREKEEKSTWDMNALYSTMITSRVMPDPNLRWVNIAPPDFLPEPVTQGTTDTIQL